MGAAVRRVVSAGSGALARWIGEGAAGAAGPGDDGGGADQTEPGEAAELLSSPQPYERCGPVGAVHVYVRTEPGPGRPDEQLDARQGGVRASAGSVLRVHARADEVRRAVCHGPDRLAAGQGGRGTDRFDLRRRID